MKGLKGRHIQVPLTSLDQLKKTRKEQNKLNRSRANNMEYRIAKLLGGRRTPSSGAMSKYKGDVEIELKNHPGKYIAECKLSAQRDMHNRPKICITFEWFTKVHEDAMNMNAKFCIVVIHFENFANDYVFIRRDTITLLNNRYACSFPLPTHEIMDWSVSKYGVRRTMRDVYRHLLESNMIIYDGIPCARSKLPDGEYVIIHLSDFRSLIREV